MNKQSFLLFWILLALILSLRLFIHFDNREMFTENEEVTLSHTLLKDPKTTTNNQSFWIDSVRIVTSKVPQYSYGDQLEVSGVVEQVLFTDKKTGDEVNYLQLSYPSIVKVRSGNPLVALSDGIRDRFAESLGVLPRDEKGLLMGIVFGIRSQISSEFSDGLLATGLMHVVAASGANVLLVGGFLSGVFCYILPRKKAVVFSSIGIVLYAVISGLDASILRATVMALFVYTAILLGRGTHGIISLFLASFLLLLFSPEMIFDVGFHLSFGATLGIILIKPIIDTLITSNFLKVIKEDFSTTVAANLAVFPILSMHFGQISLFSIFVNMLVLWTVPLIMLLGGMGAIVSLVWPPLGLPFALIALPLLTFFVRVVELFGSVSPMVDLRLSLFGVIVYAGTIFGGVYLLKKK